jgi:ribosomal protein S18 acetylase RimI-like enzyme
MIKINFSEEILNYVSAIRGLKKGYLTNFYPDSEKLNLWISKDLLFKDTAGDTLFFFRRNNNFSNVYFCSTDTQALNHAIIDIQSRYNEILVFDIVGTGKSQMELSETFLRNNFHIYCTLQRMSRLINKSEEYNNNYYIRTANNNEFEEISDLFRCHFDEYAEQLPLAEELSEWIRKGHVFVYREDAEILGFVVFDINGLTSYLRYWFVDPRYRDKKIGSGLLRRFFYESMNTKRQLFWVIDSNANAIMRYEHYGFRSENMFDNIYINLNKKYARRNH